MKLTFDLEDIKHLRLTHVKDDISTTTFKLAFKEKFEHEILAVAPVGAGMKLETPQEVDLDIICENGLYKTKTILKSVESDDEFIYYTFKNPEALDYIQNREYFRITSEYDCIYTIETDYGPESYNAVTYDISAGGVSIILDENILSKEDATLLVMMEDHNIKSHIKFMRSELFEDNYKLSFEFTDLSERDVNILEQLCISKQLKKD